jgi:aminomethyltransferase
LSESLSNDNDMADEPQGPALLPLDAWHRARGGRMVEFAGYMMPVQYTGEGGGIIAEHLWTREQAGLFDVSHMGQLAFSGEGVAAALETLLPGEISALKPGRQRYSLLLDEDGGILDDLMIANRGSGYYMVVNGATKWDDIGHLREHLPDAITMNHLDEHALLALQGPKAAEALGKLGLVPADDGTTAVLDLKFMQAGAYIWDDRPLGVSRSGYTGEDGFEISVRHADVEALADALVALPEVNPIGLGARDSLRLEAGLPLYGHDLSPETDPVAADLGFAISKRRRAEGGFLGAERVLSALADGTPRKRVGLALEGRMAAREGATIWAAEQEVGIVTSGGFSPSLQHPIAMAYVDVAHTGKDTALEIEMRGKRLPARIVSMPFVPHRYFR